MLCEIDRAALNATKKADKRKRKAEAHKLRMQERATQKKIAKAKKRLLEMADENGNSIKSED